MSILSKLKKASQNLRNTVFSGISSAVSKVSGSSQTGNALQFTNAKIPTPKQVEQPVYQKNGVTYTSAGLASVGGAVPTSGAMVNQPSQFSFGGGASGGTGTSSSFTAPPVKSSGSSKIILPKADAPTSADGVNNTVGTFNLSSANSSSGVSGTTGTMGTPTSDTANANASLANVNALNESSIKSKEQIAADEAKLAEDTRKAEDKKSILNIFDKQEKERVQLERKQADLEKEYKVQASRDEINSLQGSLDKILVERNNQIQATRDVMGSNNFINNQIDQIKRNSDPEINRLSSDINFKTGILTQNEALIEKAMELATKSSAQYVENLKWQYEQNQDILNSISPEYKAALEAKIKMEDRKYQELKATTEWKRDTILELAKKGITGLTLSDSEQVIFNTATKVAQQEGGSISSFSDIMQDEINNGSSPETAARTAASVSEAQGIQVDQKTLSSWVAQAKKMKPITQSINTTSSNTTKNISPSMEFNPKTKQIESFEIDPFTGNKTFKSSVSSNSFDNINQNNINDLKAFNSTQSSFFSNLFGG